MNAPPTPTIWFGAYGGKTSVYFNFRPTVTWTASLADVTGGWVTFDGDQSGQGSGLVTLVTQPSTTTQQTARLVVQPDSSAPPLTWPVVQISTVPLSTMNTSVLAVPFFPRTPTVMEFGIAGGFIAKQVKKIPEPFTLIALLIVEIIVVLLGVLAIVIRGMLSALVPEPKTWFGAPEPYAPLTRELRATDVFLIEETSLTAIYIAEQTLAGD